MKAIGTIEKETVDKWNRTQDSSCEYKIMLLATREFVALRDCIVVEVTTYANGAQVADIEVNLEEALRHIDGDALCNMFDDIREPILLKEPAAS